MRLERVMMVVTLGAWGLAAISFVAWRVSHVRMLAILGLVLGAFGAGVWSVPPLFAIAWLSAEALLKAASARARQPRITRRPGGR